MFHQHIVKPERHRQLYAPGGGGPPRPRPQRLTDDEVSQGWVPMMWELFNEPFNIRPDGVVHAPDRPRLGFALRADALERFRYVDGPSISTSSIMLPA